MNLTDIRLGDVVRLWNGDTIRVAYKSTSYTDASGHHEGPFVSPRSLEHYHVSNLLEVVERNERVCVYCGEGVTATKPETQFCANCFYTGRAFTELRSELIGKLTALPGVADAHVWHTGGGCFVLAVTMTDARLITATDGELGLPDPGKPWRDVCVAASEQAWSEWDEDRLDVGEGEWSDDELVWFVQGAGLAARGDA